MVVTMKNAKRLIAFLLGSVLALNLVACGSSNSSKPAASTPASSGAATSGAASAGEVEIEKMTLKAGCTNSLGSAAYQDMENFGEILSEVSGGKLEVELFGNSTLGKTAQLYAQLMDGTLDMMPTGLDTVTNLQGSEKCAALSVPYAFNSTEHFRKFLGSDLEAELMSELEEANGNKLHYLGAICLQLPRGLSTSGRAITKPQELAGLKIRVPESPIQTAVWKAWGANPIAISTSELFSSLEGGIADGQDNSVASMLNSSYWEVQDYYTETEYIQQAQVLFISSATWDKLNDTQKGWIQEAVSIAYQENTDEMWAEYDSIKKQLIENGLEFVEFDKQAFIDSAKEALKTLEGKEFAAGMLERLQELDK